MIVNIYSVTLVIYYVNWSWSDFLSALIMALLSAVQRVSSSGISIVSLQNEGFSTVCLCLTTGRHLDVTEKSDTNYRIREADGCPRIPPRAMLRWLFCYCCSLMFNAVCDVVCSGKRHPGRRKATRWRKCGLLIFGWLLHNSKG